jgi:hypothetical protein
MFIGLSLELTGRRDLSSADLLLGIGQIIALLMTGKSGNLASSADDVGQ